MSTSPKSPCEAEFGPLLSTLAGGALSPKDWERLRQHLAGCVNCRTRYDRLVLAERMLHGGPSALHTPAPPELDRIAQAVLPVERRAPVWQRWLTWWSPTPRWASGVALATLALVLIPLVAHVDAPAPAPPPAGQPKLPIELFSRVPNAKLFDRPVELRAFCLEAGKARELKPADEAPSCPIGAELKITLSNRGKFAQLLVLGLDSAYHLAWHLPPEPSAVSAAASPASYQGEVPLGKPVRLGSVHQPGLVRLYALFSDVPIGRPEVEAAVEKLRGDETAIDGASLLPLERTDVVERSLLFEVVP